jgi:multiple sugar transport system permease protein
MRRAGSNPAFTVALHAGIGALAALVLVPFAYLTIAAFKGREDFFASVFLPPGDGALGVGWSKLTLDNIVALADNGMFLAGVNSLFLSATTAVVATLCAAAGGYALACHRFRGRGVMTGVVLAALLIPPPLLLAPGYQWLYQLGLLDTYAGLILPACAPAFGIFLFRQAAMQAVPEEMLQAARLDGANELQLFTMFALPMLRPMVGTFLMITFLATWNNYISPQIVLQSEDKFPLSVAVARLKDVYAQDYGLMMAGTLYRFSRRRCCSSSCNASSSAG